VSFKCGELEHIARYCRLNTRIWSLQIEDSVLQQINNLMIETGSSEEEYELSYENEVNHLQLDGINSSLDETISENGDENLQINVIS